MASASASDEEQQPNTSRRRGRLVLAEDDSDLRQTLAQAMRRDGYEVVEVGNGWQLLQYLATHMLVDEDGPAVDLVIADIRMPGKSGLDVLAGMQWAQHPPPCILVTAFGDPQTQAEAERLGAAALLKKPFDLDDLRALISTVWNRALVRE